MMSTMNIFQNCSPLSLEPLPLDDHELSHSLIGFIDHGLEVMDDTSSTVGLEPTPMGFKNIDVVEKVPLAEAPWLQDRSFTAFLLPLLNDKLQKPEEQKSMLTVVCSNSDEDSSSSCSKSSGDSNFRAAQLEQWNTRYQDLVEFQRKQGHCLVPLSYPENPGLAHWIKRQRYQFSLKCEGKHSTLTDERQMSLEKLGFIWDSHAAAWEERLRELEEFREKHGHCYVPTKYPENPKLSIWVKCQRRQFKLFQARQRSNITQGRISKLLRLGFAFDPRKQKRSQSILVSY